LLVRGTRVWATGPRRTDVDANEGESPSLLKTSFPENGHSCPFILSVEFVMSGTGVFHFLAFEQLHDWLESIDGFRCPVANVVWVSDSKCNGRSPKGSHQL
jgi:hypothetical protein